MSEKTPDYEALIKRFDEGYYGEFEGCTPATDEKLAKFIDNCQKRSIPQAIQDELVEYYKVHDNLIGHGCDDEIIFEWLDYHNKDCLWLGQSDMDTIRCIVSTHKFTIGDASNVSYGEEYEFDTLYDMLKGYCDDLEY